MTAQQFAEWQAYNVLEPVGSSDRIEVSIALLASVVTDLITAIFSKKGASTKLSDFIPVYDPERQISKQGKKQSPEEMKQLLLAIATSHNKAIKKKRVKEGR